MVEEYKLITSRHEADFEVALNQALSEGFFVHAFSTVMSHSGSIMTYSAVMAKMKGMKNETA